MQAEILVFRGVQELYTYAVPDALAADIQVGYFVQIPLGRYTTEGVIVALSTIENTPERPLKNIIGVLDGFLPLTPACIALIHWFSNYYVCTPYKAFQTVAGKRKRHPLNSENSAKAPTFDNPHKLNTEQAHAFNTIIKSTPLSQTLIHGVTGSGKTELYMHLAHAQIQDMNSSIILIPEIALTPQFRQQFNTRFGENNIEILHSGLTRKQKDLAHARIQAGEISIIIGPRSAIFATPPQLGLIIIDEEHDGSYKQENHPRYLTHEVAQFRSKAEGAKLVLGSATPNIDRYYTFDSDKNKTIVSLTQRVKNQTLPHVHILDSREVGMNTLHPQMIKGIQNRIDKQEKSIILINRRGYSPYIVCQKCGQIESCPECQLGMTYHKDQTFRCHRCFVKKKAHNYCQNCKDHTLSFAGLAIQKIEMALRQNFPAATLYRLDKDSASTAKKLEKTLKQFNSNGDILLGTQMVAKGHDIHDVTLVGVLGIDMTLNLPDYRAPERTFQLLTQVAGRAGRGDKKGEVYVQTRQGMHYAIQASKTHDYHTFYTAEIAYRKKVNYPPFTRLINILFSSTDISTLLSYTQVMHLYLKSAKQLSHVLMTPPRPAAIEKVKEHHRYTLLIKCNDTDYIEVKKQLKKAPTPPKQVRCIPDFDPQSLL
jgi:primosomal protein N' (replication factor Y)